MAKRRKQTLLRRSLDTLAHPVVMVVALPWLMLLLTIGTISQRSIGLYASEQLFFSSAILWLGIIPLPGTVTVLAILTLSLLAKILLKSPWKPAQAGTLITHMGALLLLVGGLLTALTSEEGYITLGKDERSAAISDYHQRELAILKNGETILTRRFETLDAGTTLRDDALPFSFTLTTLCQHCEPVPPAAEEPRHGIAEKLSLAAAPLQKEDAENQAGAAFALAGAGEADGAYIAFEPTIHQPEFTLGGDTWRIVMRRAQRPLPFSVRLDDFRKEIYHGTDIPRSYESTITVGDGELAWPATIRMNQPLRYRGYTLYQSSFVRMDGQEYSVLAVVKNSGRVFPYVSSLVMCAGLLVHLWMRLKPKRRKT